MHTTNEKSTAAGNVARPKKFGEVGQHLINTTKSVHRGAECFLKE